MSRLKAGQLYGTVAAARAVGVSRRRLHYWVRMTQAVRPQVARHGVRVYDRFSRRDVARLQQLKRLIDHNGYTLRAAARRIQEET